MTTLETVALVRDDDRRVVTKGSEMEERLREEGFVGEGEAPQADADDTQNTTGPAARPSGSSVDFAGAGGPPLPTGGAPASAVGNPVADDPRSPDAEQEQREGPTGGTQPTGAGGGDGTG
jgi:hypothetical protein